MKQRKYLSISIVVVIALAILAIVFGSVSDGGEISIFRPRRTRRPTPTFRPTATQIVTKTPIPTNTKTPTSTPTSIPTSTPIPDDGVDVSIFPVPAVYLDRAAFSEKLRVFDVVLISLDSAQQFNDFPKQTTRSLLINIRTDGYPDNLEASIQTILAAANEYEIDTISYNLEWPEHSVQDKLERLKAVVAELDRQGNTLPVVLGPVFGDFLNNYSVYAPYVQGFAVQLQRAEIGSEAQWAIESIQKARSVITNPIMYFQISCQSEGEFARTVEQIVTAVIEMSDVDGIDAIYMYYARAEFLPVCSDAIETLVP